MRQLVAFLVCSSLVTVGVFLYRSSRDPVTQLEEMLGRPRQDTPLNNRAELQTLLSNTADENGAIYLSSVDSAYLPMAINLYETSFKRLGIRNYLFVCSDADAAKTLKLRGINSIQYIGDAASDKTAIYGTSEFKRKTHLKTKIILDALLLKLTVVIVDVDIIFFKDPIPYLDCLDCDIQIQSDVIEGNSGFYMARPTKPAIDLHQKSWETALVKGEEISNQKIIDRAMESMQRWKQIKVKTLDKNKFPSGYVYFEEKIRMFHWDNPPRDEVILHNNWIVSMEAKRYRFKELLWWYVDDGYYSNPTRKYLTYENPQDFGEANTQTVETNALFSALIIGEILNRTVILPTFSCHRCKYSSCKVPSKKCTFNTHYKIASFDTTWGEMNYREQVFLDNPKVPESVKVYSKTFFINRPHGNNYIKPVPLNVEVRTPASIEKGPTPDEIREWFGANSEPVLRFRSLYNILETLQTEKVFGKIKQAINEQTDYRQY